MALMTHLVATATHYHDDHHDDHDDDDDDDHDHDDDHEPVAHLRAVQQAQGLQTQRLQLEAASKMRHKFHKNWLLLHFQRHKPYR